MEAETISQEELLASNDASPVSKSLHARVQQNPKKFESMQNLVLGF
jgi:hypothetical protein